jgi:hypothetical protein
VASPREPGERPNRTTLDRPPGERYREAKTAETDVTTAAVPARGVAWAVLVAIAGAGVIAVLGGPLTVTVGLIVVAGLIGRFVSVAVLAGSGATISPRARVTATIAIAVLGVLLGQLGIWLYARSEGGVLSPLDYLAQTFGWVVAAELLVAGLVAWFTAR